MNQHIRVWRLRNQYRVLAQRIRDELKRRAPDTLVIRDLARRKLALKDQLVRAEAALA